MGELLHANAKTTIRVRKEIQESKESLAKLAKKYSLNIKTVARWRKSESVADKPSGPIKIISSLSDIDQQIVCEFRRITKLSVDDCYISLKDRIENLSRSNLYRCLKRNNLHIIPNLENIRVKKKFNDYPIGYFHIDITEIKLEKKKFYLFVAIDRTSKYAYLEMFERMTTANSCIFLNNVIKDCPYKINKILTDNGIQFTYALLATHLRPKNNKTHSFDEVCHKNNIEHRLTKFKHPWTNGQVEVMNRVIKQHTTKRYHYDDIGQLKQHLAAFLLVYNYQRPLKALKYKTPYEKMMEEYEINPSLFFINPSQKKLELNTKISAKT